MAEAVVLETAALLDLLAGTAEGEVVRDTLRGRQVHVTDYEEVGVGIALRAMRECGLLSGIELDRKIRQLAEAPFSTHRARELLVAAAARSELLLGDALCVQLSYQLAAPLLTTDSRLAAAWPGSWLVTAPPGR